MRRHCSSGCLLLQSTSTTVLRLYSTEKGADCTISCLVTLSFILITTLYFPGTRFVNGTLFSTVIWSELDCPACLLSSDESSTVLSESVLVIMYCTVAEFDLL